MEMEFQKTRSELTMTSSVPQPIVCSSIVLSKANMMPLKNSHAIRIRLFLNAYLSTIQST